VIDDQIPHAGPGEIRVKVLAAGVSSTDAMVLAGSYGVPKPPPTPGYQLAGTVEELGRDVRGCRSETVSARDRVGCGRGATLGIRSHGNPLGRT
jgi:NADPH:quinone reductase-like Zn-dependent oxidoreductase